MNRDGFERNRLHKYPRWYRWLYALVGGYYWAKCSSCGKGYGGCEDHRDEICKNCREVIEKGARPDTYLGNWYRARDLDKKAKKVDDQEKARALKKQALNHRLRSLKFRRTADIYEKIATYAMKLGEYHLALKMAKKAFYDASDDDIEARAETLIAKLSTKLDTNQAQKWHRKCLTCKWNDYFHGFVKGACQKRNIFVPNGYSCDLWELDT